MPTRILSVSYDDELLKARHLMLQLKEYDAVPAMGFAEAMAFCRINLYDILIVDHTVPREEKIEIARAYRVKSRDGQIVNLHATEEPAFAVKQHDVAFDDPRELLNVIASILRAKARAAGT